MSGLTRREALVATAASGAAYVLSRGTASAKTSTGLDFSIEPAGEGWGPGWACVGVANLRRVAGEGLLVAGSDVFPNDPRPVAFAVDQRFRDGAIRATIARTGDGPGVVLRRVGPRAYYAAIYDRERSALILIRREGTDLHELASAPAPLAATPLMLSLRAVSRFPTLLEATLRSSGGLVRATASDSAAKLQRAGDPGVFATSRTLLPSGSAVLPALGNLHLLPYSVQEGQAVLETPAGEAFVDQVRERSTVAFRKIELSSAGRARRTRPSVLAATTGPPLGLGGSRAGRGALLQVATDVPARVVIDISTSPSFRRRRTLRPGRTGAFESLIRPVRQLPAGRRVYWRARVRRGGARRTGPTRSFRVLPAPGSGQPLTLAVAACGTQFGSIFDDLAARRPDVLIWQGDLNYPDTHGPLAQSMSGYAGIWRDFLANPRLAPIFARSHFAAQRDDHDYGVQDARADNLVPWGLAPWEALMGRRTYYRFAAGLVEVWVLDQRRFKSDPAVADTTDKSLLGRQQRTWLLRTLAASRAPFKIVCSPCSLFHAPNARDGNWSEGFTAERDLILAHIAKRVSGRSVFLTGDVHTTMVYDQGGVFEIRACPIDIPNPRDTTLVNPLVAEQLRSSPGVAYGSDQSHFTLVEARREGSVARLHLTLVREDGATPFGKRFEQPLPSRRRRRRR